jgi:cyclophilin family peptidyl-prolyl cis-trans isomerase
MRRALLLSVVLAGILTAVPIAQTAKPPATPDPVFVLETLKGTIEIRLFRSEAPKSVDHMVELIKRSFYRGQRFHRVTASLAQTGDPQSRNMSREAYWGSGNSGNPIGVFEYSKKRTHVRGAVGLAHSGNPLGADSQFYIMKTASPGLNGKHAIVGQVIAGMAVVDKIVVPDMIKDTKLK